MKVNIAWESKSRAGGGYSFMGVLKEALSDSYDDDWKSADIIIVPSASVITKELFREMIGYGKKVVLRVDNSLKHSRNRGGGMNKLKEFSEGAVEVVYQGKWCRDYLSGYLGREGVIIHNGIDVDMFNPVGPKVDFGAENAYLYSNMSGGVNKGWHAVWYQYQEVHRKDPDAKLVVVGKLPREVVESGSDGINKYDFFNGERVEYIGMIPASDRRRMAMIYRGCKYLFAPYQYDAFSQTYIEALCSGSQLYKAHMSGGTPEILRLFDKYGRQYFNRDRMAAEYLTLFEKLI